MDERETLQRNRSWTKQRAVNVQQLFSSNRGGNLQVSPFLGEARYLWSV